MLLASTLHQHQKWTHTERGNSLEPCASTPAVVYDKTQACELGRAVDARSFSRIQIAADLPPRRRPVRLNSSRCIGQHSPAARHSAERGAFIPCVLDGANRPHAQSTLHEPSVNASALAGHHHRLSSSHFAWSQPSEALNGRVQNTTGAFHKNEGELPNVGS